MADDLRGPYQLDPFNHIIAIHFPGKEVTKLDFVNNRYKVRNQLQLVADVIDHPEWRGAQGLDLRGDVDITAANRVAKLINKTGGPTNTIRGALSEFTFLDYTIVAEFEWLNRAGAWYAYDPERDPANGGIGYDFFDTILRSAHIDAEFGFVDHQFEIDQGLQRNIYPGVDPFKVSATDDFDEWHLSTAVVGRVREVEPGEALLLLDQLTGNIRYFISHPEGEYVVWERTYKYDFGGPPGIHYPRYDNTGGGLHPDGLNYYPTVFADELILPFGETPIDDDLQSYVWSSDTPPFTTGSNTNTLITYDTPDYSDNSAFRSNPTGLDFFDADADNGSAIGGNTAPYGIVRMAINVTPGKLVLSINGGNPITVTQASSFPMPRVPSGGKTWFANDEAYEFMFNFCGWLRCMWLFRTKKPDDQLKTMSAVQPLPAASSPKWDKPPGQDQ